MTRTHEIKLDGYGAHTTLAEDRPVMLLGTAESYGIEMLHVVSGKSWESLTITATFDAPDGTSTDMLMDAAGSITVPPEATAKSGSGRIVFAGVSEGVQRISCDLEYFVVAHSAINGVQSGGTAPSWFEQAANRFMPLGGTTGQVLTKKTGADFDAEWQDSKGGGGTTDHSQLINRDIADQHPISAITGLEEALTPLTGTTETLTPAQVYDAIKSGKSVVLQHTDSQFGLFTFASFNIFEEEKAVVSTSIAKNLNFGTYLVGSLAGSTVSNKWVFNITTMAEADDIPVAVNNALAQAKESGEFDGADGLTPTIGDNGNWYLGETDTGKPSRGEKGDKGDKGDTGATGATGAAGAAGKSAYAYAQDGGYTGTEEQFAAKLAKEKFANPYALTFTGAVTGSYDGSEPVTVEIPSGGGGSGGSTAEWQLLGTYTMLVSDRALRINLSQFNGITHFRIIGKFPKCSNDCGDTCINFGTTFNQTKQPLNGQNVYAFNLLAECELVDGQLYGFIGAIDGWNWRPVASVAMNSPRDSGKCTEFNIYYTKLVEDSTENTIQIWGY